MLNPDQRELFLRALCPPDDYRFDRGIGTTFTLDLLTLLVVPLSLAWLEVADAAMALGDPVLLLKGLHHHADRLTVFCQAGRIAIPPPGNYLFSLLEDRIVQVQAPRGGVFHPKMWLLRYVTEKQDDPPLYRLLNPSRNLTFDKSWDLMLRLEGHVATHRTRAYGRNNPLGDFVQQLPVLAVYDRDRQRVAEDIDLLQREVRRVEFKVPEPFNRDALAFYPSGIPGHYQGFSFDQHSSRVMVLSPFLSDSLLQQVTAHGGGHVLVSRVDSLAALQPETLARFEKHYVLDDNRCGSEQEEADASVEAGEEVAGARREPSGLHAKLFILESGWDATWLVGSANATNAAFNSKNVELMIGLRGRKSEIGIDKVLGDEEKAAFRSLLKTYSPQDGDVTVKESERQAENLANRARTWLVVLEMRLRVRQQEADRFDLLLHCEHTDRARPEGVYRIKCWPVTLRPESGIALELAPAAKPLVFADLSLLALTPFVAFEIVAQTGDAEHRLRFVLKLPLSGVPEERDAHLFSAIISDRVQFQRYLWLILAEGDAMPQWMDWAGKGQGEGWRMAAGDQERPLLEALLHAFSRSPKKIGRIGKLIERLRCTPKGQGVLPDGFEALWDAVIQARSDMQ